MPKHLDKEVADKLWEGVKGSICHAIRLFVTLGVKPDRKRMPRLNAKDTLIESLEEVTKTAYQSGLDHGYDMAAHVFAGPDIVAISDVELRAFELAQVILEGVVASMPVDKNAKVALAAVTTLVKIRSRDTGEEVITKTGAPTDV